MNVASLELCRELYELSGWQAANGSWWVYDRFHVETVWDATAVSDRPIVDRELLFPAYDLGYLLRKLPPETAISVMGTGFVAEYGYSDSQSTIGERASSPEDAAAQLCIELIREGILKPEGREAVA